MPNYMDFINEYRILIPLIQRDYVQGARRNFIKREEFLNSIFDALITGKILNLDFIYGTFVESDGAKIFQPIDGQQRLTTLYLLAWLLSQRYTETPQLQPLSYKTRNATDQFLRRLCAYRLPQDFDFSKENCISQHLQSVPDWFAEEWLEDPSIVPMLEMIDAMNTRVQERISSLEMMGKRFFFNNPMVFEILPMEKFDLDEDLYIKMNARGKHLSNFENWKASFGEFLKKNFKSVKYDKSISIPDYFDHAIETTWCDLFWDAAYKKWQISSKTDSEYPSIDAFFMNFFIFVTEFLFFSNLKNPGSKEEITREALTGKHGEKWLQNVEDVYGNIENVKFLFAILDKLASIGSEIDNIFSNLLCNDVNYDAPDKVNIWSDSLNLFNEVIWGKNPGLAYRALLFAILKRLLIYGENNKSGQFTDFIRVFWAILLSYNYRDANGAKVEWDFRPGQIGEINGLLNELLTNEDVFISLDALPIAKQDKGLLHNAIRREKRKARFRKNGKYEAVKILSQYPELRCNLTHVLPALDALDAKALLKSFRNFIKLPDSDKIRLLSQYDYNGCKTWNDQCLFFGLKDHWPYIFNTPDASFTTLFTKLVCGQKVDRDENNIISYYMEKYAPFRDSSPIFYFIVYSPYQIWARNGWYYIRNGKSICPYAATVMALLPEEVIKSFDITCDGKDSEHAYLCLDKLKIYMLCTDEGWEIDLYQKNPKNKTALACFEHLTISEDETLYPERYERKIFRFNDHILQDRAGRDRVETALDFINSLYSHI